MALTACLNRLRGASRRKAACVAVVWRVVSIREEVCCFRNSEAEYRALTPRVVGSSPTGGIFHLDDPGKGEYTSDMRTEHT